MELKFILLLTQSLCFVAVSSGEFFIRTTQDETIPPSNDVSILAMGLSGAGVFSTVNKLLNGQAEKSQSENPTVTEYSWPVVLPGENCTVRIAVSPGQIDGKTAEYDSKTLSSVKEYIKSESGLSGRFPSIVLVISRFDDTRPDGSNSNFVKMLKNVQMLKNELGYSSTNSTNLIFLLTRLASISKQEARRPNQRIDNFRSIIKSHSDFLDPIVVTVGENFPDEYDLKTNGWDITLPNRQLYPRNVVDEMLKSLNFTENLISYDILNEAFKDPNNFPIPVPTVKTFTSNSTEYSNSIIRSSFGSSADSEISHALQLAYDTLDENLKINYPATLQIVQGVFQNENITTRAELPKTMLEKVKLFQKLPFNPATLALVEKAFELKQPWFIHPTIVGYGYDILKDTVVGKSPYVLGNFHSTPIGYSFPDIYDCSVEENEKFVENFQFIESYEEFKHQRLQHLQITSESVNSSAFSGAVRPSFNNINPAVDEFIALAAIQQIQNFQLNLIVSSPLDAAFTSDVKDLTPFDLHDTESEKDWKAFFGKYGTHIITQAFGGGYMEGKATGDVIEKNLKEKNLLTDIKDTLISFQNLSSSLNSEELQMSYTFIGGAPDAKMANLATLPEEERKNLFDAWKNSVKSDPRIMDIDIQLIPISQIAHSINETIGEEIQKSLDLLLRGNLTYVRKRKRTPPRKPATTDTADSTTTTTPKTTTTTPKTTTTTPKITSTTSNAATTTKDKKLNDDDYSNFNAFSSSPTTTTAVNPSCPVAGNIIGQGYHIFQDSILPNSPFEIIIENTNGMKLPKGVLVENLVTPSSVEVFKTFSTFSHYATHRINSINTLPSEIMENVNFNISGYQETIKPGHNIMDKISSNGPFSVYIEFRNSNVIANFANFRLREDFITTANNLKPLSRHFENCKVNEEWLDFFETYGTHVVKTGYGGVWKDYIMGGVTLGQMQSEYKTPVTIREHQTIPSSLEPGILISSVTFCTLKQAIEELSNEQFDNLPIMTEYDNVIKALFENKLTRCNKPNATFPATKDTSILARELNASSSYSDSEISKDLQSAYVTFDKNMKINHPGTLQILQMAFGKDNITTRADLPKTMLETVKLFQKLPFNPAALALVEKAFLLKQPSFIHPTIVGNGYDILKDTVVGKSPYILRNFQPTPIGYSFPDIYTCTAEKSEKIVENFHFIESYDEFISKRLEHLKINQESVNSSAFSGAVRSSFNNINPESDEFIALTAIQQIHNFQLNLIESSPLDETFISEVNNLNPFDQHDTESEKEWKSFFGKYGTHIITQAFGGGYMEGKATGDVIRQNLEQKGLLTDIKDTLIYFQNLSSNINSEELQMSYTFVGGTQDANMANLATRPEEERKNLFDAWKSSVKADPRIMYIDLQLIPISQIAHSIDETIGQEIKKSLDLLLLGNLNYVRKRNKPSTRKTSTTTSNTTILSRTPQTTVTSKNANTMKDSNNNRLQNYPHSAATAESPSSSCPVAPAKECSFCQHKRADYTKNILGQGYHILQDTILPKSPFTNTRKMQNKVVIPVPGGVSVENMTEPMRCIFFNVIPTYSDYAQMRMNSTHTIPEAMMKMIKVDNRQYQGFVKAGFNVNNKINSNGPYSYYVENRYSKVEAEFAKFTLSDKFTSDASKLKSYFSNLRNCQVHEEWLDFFKKYGTHVVKAGYGGTWTYTREMGRTEQQLREILSKRKTGIPNDDGFFCEPKIIDTAERFSLLEPGVMPLSLTFETLKNVLYDYFRSDHRVSRVRVEYDVILARMLEGKLKRCNK